MRPLFWGIIATAIAFIGWVAASIVCALGSITQGDPGIVFLSFMYVFAFIWMFSLPVVIVIEIVQWYRRRRSVDN